MKPIFIGGCQRSGTTMLGSMLGAPLDAICVPETQFIVRQARTDPGILDGKTNAAALVAKWSKDQRFRLWRIDREALERPYPMQMSYAEVIAALILSYAQKEKRPSPAYWVDHTPTNVRHAALLFKIFHDARMIHIVRDGRAIAASFLKLEWGPKTIHTAAYYWLSALSYCFAAESYWTDRILRVRYEDLLQRPRHCLNQICDFCGIPFEPSMIDGGSFKSPIRTSSQHRLVGRPPVKERAASWRSELNPRQIEIFESIAGDVLHHLGYDTLCWPCSKPLRGLERYRLDLSELINREILKRWRIFLRNRRELKT
jgi:hypothetical protein